MHSHSHDLEISRTRTRSRDRVEKDHRHYGLHILGAIGVFGLLLLAVSLLTRVASAEPWQSEENVVEGVLRVHSPDTPRDGQKTLDLQELWRLGGETDDEDEFFGVIAQIRTDGDGNIYLLDAQLSEVKIFSPDGEFLRSIGREGEGPGEFRSPGSLYVTEDGTVGVLQQRPGRIVLLTPGGDPAGEHPIPPVEGGGFRELRSCNWGAGQMVLASGSSVFENGVYSQKMTLDIVGPDGDVVAELCSKTAVIDFTDAVVKESEWDGFWNRWGVAPDGRVMAVSEFGEYKVTMWTPDGSVDRVISRDYERRQRTDEEVADLRKIYEAFIRQVPNGSAGIEPYDMDIWGMWVRDDGSLWVLSSWGFRDRPAGALGTFDVFDDQGRFELQVTLMGEGDPLDDGYFFVGDRVYVVTDLLSASAAAQGSSIEGEELDEEPAPMEVICYQLDPSMAGL